MSQDYDVVIAGAGAGGGFCAMELCRLGYKVLLLERGKRFDFTRDYPMNHPNWELQARAFSFRANTFDHVKTPAIDPSDYDICSGDFEQGVLAHRQPKRRGRFQYQRAIGVGGSTLHYQGEAHRFPEHAFKPKTLFNWGQDWPLDYKELAPYYQQAEKTLGVAGQRGNPFKPQRGIFPTPAHALSTCSQFAKLGSDKLGWSLLPNTLALPSQSIDGRMACQHSGGCVEGCIFGAKSSTDLSAIRIAENTGNLSLITNSRLLQIETDTEGEVAGFVYKQDGKLKRAQAARYVLALGAIETPRMLLASQGGRYPQGLGNTEDNVGRYFMETILASLDCTSNLPLHSYKGPPLDARCWNFSKPKPPLNSGFVLGVGGTTIGRSPVTAAWSTAGIGLEHKQGLRQNFGRGMHLFSIAEHIPARENRLTLSNHVDDDGIPQIRVYSDYSKQDKRTLRTMITRILEWSDACNLTQRNSLYSSYDHSSATHVGGTCRMGADPETSVTDAYGRVHGTNTLFIADASVLPSQGAGDSPSLTIQALAIRLAQQLM